MFLREFEAQLLRKGAPCQEMIFRGIHDHPVQVKYGTLHLIQHLLILPFLGCTLAGSLFQLANHPYLIGHFHSLGSTAA
ncbi:hypothetical protein D3C86_1569900 [compost metagenome]